MLLFDLSEQVDAGWPVSSDIRRKKLYLDLGRDKTDQRKKVILRFGTSLRRLFFPEVGEQADEELLRDLYISKGVLIQDTEYGLCLAMARRYEDGKALVRTWITPGVEGRVTYAFEQGVAVIAEGVAGDDSAVIPVFLLMLEKGGRFTMHRTGELEGAPERMTYVWDGQELIVT